MDREGLLRSIGHEDDELVRTILSMRRPEQIQEVLNGLGYNPGNTTDGGTYAVNPAVQTLNEGTGMCFEGCLLAKMLGDGWGLDPDGWEMTGKLLVLRYWDEDLMESPVFRRMESKLRELYALGPPTESPEYSRLVDEINELRTQLPELKAHGVLPFRQNGAFGAFGQSRHGPLTGREPKYGSIADLAASYTFPDLGFHRVECADVDFTKAANGFDWRNGDPKHDLAAIAMFASAHAYTKVPQ